MKKKISRKKLNKSDMKEGPCAKIRRQEVLTKQLTYPVTHTFIQSFTLSLIIA